MVSKVKLLVVGQSSNKVPGEDCTHGDVSTQSLSEGKFILSFWLFKMPLTNYQMIMH